jgi:hypothetical protein
MAASKLTLFNGALALLKERPLASLSENREPRRALDSAWDRGAVKACLEDGQWKHAARTVMLDASVSITPDFGYQYGFDKPDDFVRLMGIWSDEMLSQPFSDYREEAGFWYGSLETMYVKYVSDHASYGMDLSLWPQSFVELVEAELAAKVAGPMTDAGKEMLQLRAERLTRALSRDAMVDPTKHPPAGSWVTARRGGVPRKEGRWTT